MSPRAMAHCPSCDHAETTPRKQTWPRRIGRLLLGGLLVTAGVAHLTALREEFQAEVPNFATELSGMSRDEVVVASGWVEIALGSAIVLTPPRMRATLGKIAALFFVAVFPGNVSQWYHRRTAFGMDTDEQRFLRLLFQPLLVVWALWSTRVGHRKH